MSETIPINPDVLKWARETAGLRVGDVVKKMKRKRVTAETILSWENGEDSPSYPQLERIAYEIYKRPLALFFFPDPPEEESPKQSFRTLPDITLEQLPAPLHFLIRKSRALQINLEELLEGTNPAPRQIVRDLFFEPAVSSDEMASAVRDYLKVDLPTQISWKNSEEALKNWRNTLEECGVFVFKDAFRVDGFSGFCLYDDVFPLIYVNNSSSKNRQIFTLFHELAHLIFQTGGIDTPDDTYLRYLKGTNHQIEVLCNRFAGGFLVPGDDFDKVTRNITVTDDTMIELAHRYHVSREVILIKLLNQSTISQEIYDAKLSKWRKSGHKSAGAGGDYYRNIGAYLSGRYLETVFVHYYQNRLTSEQVADYLGIKVKSIPGLENVFLSKGSAA